MNLIWENAYIPDLWVFFFVVVVVFVLIPVGSIRESNSKIEFI